MTPHESSGSKQDTNGHHNGAAMQEKELAAYLQRRIKPGLNRGSIPLLARSIAKELANQEAAGHEQPADGSGASAEEFEDEMHDLQGDLGDDWILRFSVHNDDAWLTAEKDDGSQRVEAPTADVLVKAVKLLNKRGGRA